MFISCISIFPAWYLVIYTYKIILKIFLVQKNFHSVNCFRPGGRPVGRPVLFQARTVDRPGRPRPMSRTCTFVHVCRSTDLKQLALCFFVGRPYRSTGPNGYLPDGLLVDRADRPIACLEPQRLFPLWWFSEKLFLLLFIWQSFLIFWGLILDHLNLIESCFNPFLSL